MRIIPDRNHGKTVIREMITRIVMGNHMVTEIHRIIAKKQIFRLQVKMLILIITCLRCAQINTVTYSTYANEVLRLVNIERTNVGVAPLVLDEALCNAANMRAIEMDCTGVFEHKRPNGNSCFEVYDKCNVEWQSACGENIAAGQATPEDVMKSWLSSAGHKANILSPEYTKNGAWI